MELISIHIPKCAGCTFSNTLRQIYTYKFHTIYNNTFNFPPHIQVIHGHFPATPQLLEKYPNAKLITWLRHPVSRLHSYYHFWKTIGRHGNPNHDFFIDNNLSIIDFAQVDFMQNEMFGYIDKVSLDSFDFMGFIENYDVDLKKLYTIMNWSYNPIEAIQHKVNCNSSKPTINSIEQKELETLLQDDIEKYNELKHLSSLH